MFADYDEGFTRNDERLRGRRGRLGVLTPSVATAGRRGQLLSRLSVVPEHVSHAPRDRRPPRPGARTAASARGGLAAARDDDERVPALLRGGRHRRRLSARRRLRLLEAHERGAVARARRPGPRQNLTNVTDPSHLARQAGAPLARGVDDGARGIPERVRWRGHRGPNGARAGGGPSGVVADGRAAARPTAPAAESPGGLPNAGPDPLRRPRARSTVDHDLSRPPAPDPRRGAADGRFVLRAVTPGVSRSRGL